MNTLLSFTSSICKYHLDEDEKTNLKKGNLGQFRLRDLNLNPSPQKALSECLITILSDLQAVSVYLRI